MSQYPFSKALGLVIILLINILSVQIYAQNQTSLILKNNTDFIALFCINDIYKNTISPKSQVSVLIPTGNQKIDLIALDAVPTSISCNYNYTVTDQNGLPAHGYYSDNFYDYENYFYTLNQSLKSTTISNITYQIASPIASLNITAIDLSAIPATSGFSNNQLCVDSVTSPPSMLNVVNIAPGTHKLSLVSTLTLGCADPVSAIDLTVLADNTYKYTKAINNTVTNQMIYQGVADFKAKLQPQQQNKSTIQASLDIPIPSPQEKSPVKEIIPLTNKEQIKDQKIDEIILAPLLQSEKLPELIKYDKLTIDRVSRDKIEDGIQSVENQGSTAVLNKNNTSSNSKIEWSIISVITTMLYLGYDVMIYLLKKSRASFVNIKV